MTRDSLAFALSGTLFGLLVGWIIGSQHAASAPPEAVAAAAQATPASGTTAAAGRPLDAAEVSRLEQQASANPGDARVRAELGNLYFDAERFDQAIPWYEAAFKLAPTDVNVSTDLGVAYYYTNQPDKALAQLDVSLGLDPRHLKTLLNQGIVRAFGKRDLEGAAESWQKVVQLAPTSEEGLHAQQGLDGLRAAHQNAGAAEASAPATTAQ